MTEQLQELTLKITKAFDSGAFPNFINYIRFPFFKNIKEDTVINFDFPFTVLTGVNGSGKSSALHAIYGAPEGYSTGQFWFSTSVDPILNEKGNPPAYIYAYKNSQDQLVEVLKTRVGTSKGSDYWEPSRPIKKYGMQLLGGKRIPAIQKKVIYLDFRSELSAFDKYFYHGNFKSSKTLKSKQDVLRKYSFYVKYALDNSKPITVRSRKSKTPIVVDQQTVQDISKILGKTYQQCRILVHDLYNSSGTTIYFKTNNLKYSEAFAGRGEFAVVKLVYEINNADNGSLIILDEPEVSLHPGAQEQLKLFLLKKTLSKKLQVIVSTHSPKLVEYLPPNAIKLFYESSDSKFSVNNTCSYLEAFKNIGIEINEGNKKTIIVEDITAQKILESIINDLGGDFPLLFSVKYYPGGAENIYKKAATYSEEHENHKFILLDGDKRKPKYTPQNFTQTQLENFDFLAQKIKEETTIEFKNLGFRIDGNEQGGNAQQKINSAIRYLRYLDSNLEYFPGNIPEEIIWDNSYAKSILSVANKQMPEDINDYKKKFATFSSSLFGNEESTSIQSSHQMFIQNFIAIKGDKYVSIVKILKDFRQLIDG